MTLIDFHRRINCNPIERRANQSNTYSNYLNHDFRFTDTHDVNGLPIITIEAKTLMESGLNCYEIATLILYYNTIPSV